ncbi:hypothetical protein VA7868_03711 [Vibrio aerogenes CECT 7868]|uniref:HEAT repeat protein n=1 Tax=Vibrio aerogenes CECT 7868 TaxID=1216006 RepID=A0A1M6B553_9VIBR|nr:hypothetical protein [Vibrio aerogenes]SHI43790.1 hypothetical protein VA7868_03711 [Vibrio aerogenes CECT 7868]
MYRKLILLVGGAAVASYGLMTWLQPETHSATLSLRWSKADTHHAAETPASAQPAVALKRQSTPDTSGSAMTPNTQLDITATAINPDMPVMLSIQDLFARIDASGRVPDDLFQALQKRLETDDHALNDIMTMIESTDLGYEEKYLLAELLSTRKDSAPIDFTLSLMQSASAQSLSVGAELATSLMMNGRPADILAPLVQGSYSQDAQAQIDQVISRVPNASMDETQRTEVEHLLTGYIDSTSGKMKSVAIESLAGVVAGDAQKLKSLFHEYADDGNDAVRYSAIEALYQLEPAQFDSGIAKDLQTIANNSSESMSVRASAMELLASYQESPGS